MLKIPLFPKPTVPLAMQIRKHLEEVRTKQTQIVLHMNEIETLVHLLQSQASCSCGNPFDAENPGYCVMCAESIGDPE